MLLFVGGPAGSGKSVVGQGLAQRLDFPFLEGDSYHPQSNIDKMSRGTPLEDDDRWPWLKTLALEGSKHAQQSGNCVVACSALKKSYRDYLRKNATVDTAFVILNVNATELLARLHSRQNHFMKADMIESQVKIMELPRDEPKSIVFDVKDNIDDTIQEVYGLVQPWFR